MRKIQIGTQLYNFRDLLEGKPDDLKQVLMKIKDLGYEGVELAGTYGLKPEKLRDILKESGLVPVSAHVPFEEMEEDIEKTVADYKTIGIEYIVVPWLTKELHPGTDKFEYVVESIGKFAECSKKHGLPMLYHNHDFEFYKMPTGEYALDYIYRINPAELLGVEPDTCWITYAGANACQYLEKYADRIPIVHLKDFCNDAGVFEFRPIGEGVQDWEKIMNAIDATSARWMIVEQDCHNGIGALEAARRSKEFLKSKGFIQ